MQPPGTIREWIFRTYIYNIKSVEEVNLFKYVKLVEDKESISGVEEAMAIRSLFINAFDYK